MFSICANSRNMVFKRILNILHFDIKVCSYIYCMIASIKELDVRFMNRVLETGGWHEGTNCTKERWIMWDRLYIIAYLIKAKFRHPAAKVGC